MLHRNAKWTQWGQVSFTPGVEFMQPLNRLTQTLWRSLYVTSALRHCDEVCGITIQSEHIEAKFIFVVGGKFYSTGSSLTGARISLCDEKLTPFLFLKGFFFCFFTTSTSHDLAFSTLLFCSIYILTFSVFLSTFSFIQIFSCRCCIIWNLYCKLFIFMLC